MNDTGFRFAAAVGAALLGLSLFARGCDPQPVPDPIPDPVVVDPKPDPVPVPVPDPIPDPIPVSDFRVLIIEETAHRGQLKPSQQAILTSAIFREWLTESGAKLRVWDQDIDAAREDAQWKAMLAKPRQSLPWIVVTGRGEYSGPLPNLMTDAQVIIARHKP